MEGLIKQAREAVNRYVTYRFEIHPLLQGSDLGWITFIIDWLAINPDFAQLKTSNHLLTCDGQYGYLIFECTLDNDAIQADLKVKDMCYFPLCPNLSTTDGWCSQHCKDVEFPSILIASRMLVVINLICSIEYTYRRLVIQPHPLNIDMELTWEGLKIPLSLQLYHPKKMI